LQDTLLLIQMLTVLREALPLLLNKLRDALLVAGHAADPGCSFLLLLLDTLLILVALSCCCCWTRC
jgi:hypothetical protein